MNVKFVNTNFQEALPDLTIVLGKAKTFSMPPLVQGSSPYSSHKIKGTSDNKFSYDPIANTFSYDGATAFMPSSQTTLKITIED